MLQIDLPNIDNIKLWDEIVSNKRGIHKSNLLQCRHIVLERYVFYQSHYESLEEITPLDTQFWENIKEDLHSCYGNNVRFLYKGIIIKHNKTEPTYTKTSLFLCEKRRFFMARTEKGVVTTI